MPHSVLERGLAQDTMALAPAALRLQAEHLLENVAGNEQLVRAAMNPLQAPLYRERGWDLEGRHDALAKMRDCVPLKYLQELVLTAARERRVYSRGLVAELEVRSDGIGLPEEHPLTILRDNIIANKPSTDAPPVVPLILWGASEAKGKTLYQELGLLLRDTSLHLDFVGDKWSLMEDWVAWSGVRHKTALATAHALIDKSFESSLRSPNVGVPAHKRDGEGFALLDAKLTHWVLGRASSIASSLVLSDQKSARFAYQVWRCCSRIAAYTQRGWYCYWRAEWLRGNATQAPIPGASTFSQELTRFLQEEVFAVEPVKKYSAGKSATIYQLRFPFSVGCESHQTVAKQLGLNLDESGCPRRR